MKKIVKRCIFLVLPLLLLSGCNVFQNEWNEMIASWKGRSVTIKTFDEDAEQIDSISGKAIKIQADEEFDIYLGNDTYEKGDVLKITIGKNVMHHVGSSLIAVEDGLETLDVDYYKMNIESHKSSTPFLELLKSDIANTFSGRRKLILIRSQSGKPIAVYGGDKVSLFAPKEIKKSTVLLVDGKYIFIHRCDYTIYDMDLIN